MTVGRALFLPESCTSKLASGLGVGARDKNRGAAFHIRSRAGTRSLHSTFIALPVGNGTECIGCAESEASRPVER